IGILRPSRIGKSKRYRPSRCRVVADRKNRPWQFCVGGSSLFVQTASFRTRREQSSGSSRFPLVIQNQYSACQAAECLRSLHSRQSRVQGTTSKRALETGSLHIWHTPNVPCLIRASASSIARKRGGPGPGQTTELLRSRCERLTCLELDLVFASPLRKRMQNTSSPTASLMLFSAGEADSRGEGSALASRKLAEIGGVDVVHYDVGILPVDGVHHLDARGPQISAKGELLF